MQSGPTQASPSPLWFKLTGVWIVALFIAQVVWVAGFALMSGKLDTLSDITAFALILALALVLILLASVALGIASERLGVRNALSWVPGFVLVLLSGFPRMLSVGNGFGPGGWTGLIALGLGCACVPLGVRIGRLGEARRVAQRNIAAGLVKPARAKADRQHPVWWRRRLPLGLATLCASLIVFVVISVGTDPVLQEQFIGLAPLPAGHYDEQSSRYLYYHNDDDEFVIELVRIGDWPAFEYTIHATPQTVWKLDGERVSRREFIKAVTAGDSIDEGTYIEYSTESFDVGANGTLSQVNELAIAETALRTEDGVTSLESTPLP